MKTTFAPVDSPRRAGKLSGLILRLTDARKGRGARKRLVLRLGGPVHEAAGLRKGERIVFAIDWTSRVLVVERDPAGFVLSRSAKSCLALNISATWPSDPLIADRLGALLGKELTAWSIQNSKIVVQLPSTSEPARSPKPLDSSRLNGEVPPDSGPNSVDSSRADPPVASPATGS